MTSSNQAANLRPSLPARTLVVIGASTGGTRVLTTLLSGLPRLSAAVLIVQHMPRFINASLTASLSRSSRMPVRLATEGAILAPGEVLLAPSEVHCAVVNNARVRLFAGPKVNYVCPAIDVTMESLRAPAAGGRLIGVLLTGMGNDGAAGLAHVKRLGGVTIAQSESTCAVYGMPAEAVRLGCVDHQLAPEAIIRFLAREAV